MIKVFDMFAGYGGAEFALKKAGIEHECVGFSEIDGGSIKCFTTNFPGVKNFGDCTKINPKELPDFDLLCGGFPCQPFSEAGKHKGELDMRGTLFNDIIRIATVKKPKWMLLENVKGLTSNPHKRTFEKILSELDKAGYNVHWKVLNSKEHGIPQSRERVFFACFRKDINGGCFDFPEKEKLDIFLKDIVEPPEKEMIVSVAIRNKNRAKHQAKGLPYGTFPKLYHLKHNPDIGVSYAIKSATHEFMVGRLEDIQAENKRLERNNMTPRDRFRYIKSMNIRDLTPKECFRLMGFLNDEISLDGLTNAQKYKLAGNGWDINIVSKIFTQMFMPCSGKKNKSRAEKQLKITSY